MAKRRPINPSSEVAIESESPTIVGAFSLQKGSLGDAAIAMLGATLVYTAYHPSDSIAAEQGDALWFAMFALAIATVTAVASRFGKTRQSEASDSIATRILQAAPWVMGGWVFLAAFATSSTWFVPDGGSSLGNLRSATNEAWVWLAGAAIFTSTRRLTVGLAARRSMMILAIAIATGLAVHGLHQHWVSLPADRQAFQQDPDAVVAMVGLDAPAGTAERMRFANRLFDGGPSATFALANSFAAVLLVGVVVVAGIVRFRFAHWTNARRGIAVAMVLVLVAALLAARSRSATLAMLMAVGWLVLSSIRIDANRKRRWAWGIAIIAAVASIGIAGLALFGNREWFEQAPASLAFRFQYWRSTWQMFLDRPWFGAGPGNFQSIYERYREASSTEQISDPHSFVFETLATGGWVATAALMLLMGVGIKCWLGRGRDQIEDVQVSGGGTSAGVFGDSPWLLSGAVVGFLLTWSIGWISHSIPDFDASLFAVPIALAAGYFATSAVGKLSSECLDRIFVAVLIAMAIHLSVAGGWTVPGVAVWVWVCAGIVTGVRASATGTSSASPKLGTAKSVALVGAMAALYFMSLRPVGRQQYWMVVAEVSQSTGQIGKARLSLEKAIEADPWATAPVLWMTDFLRWELIRKPNEGSGDEAIRLRLAEWIDAAKARSGDDPSVFRQIGVGQLHLYQRFGNAEDLAAASATFHDVVRWSPANQWAMAQMSLIADAEGDTQSAETLAARAKALSEQGGNLERALYLQSIYVARPIGIEAAREPVRGRADELLGFVPTAQK
ncbi:O-Antigen ligase [Rubripirellula tenax]|uniref:O-Antigen ligase n=1 Tax=Rubripirellula tenax TaxID=2528015 RepID=A0A5C6F591_9BACT|nr:O-antigen ligase family protein [Rubripirellula tenax]TWU56518.1 O-Antigen ligase [Rubripirellula tenax]